MEQLNAWAIGPDRFEVVVGFDKESAIAYYEQETGVTDWGKVREFPMDTPLMMENDDGLGHSMRTLREDMSSVEQFPVIACYAD